LEEAARSGRDNAGDCAAAAPEVTVRANLELPAPPNEYPRPKNTAEIKDAAKKTARIVPVLQCTSVVSSISS
jgi:hypothetical protein